MPCRVVSPLGLDELLSLVRRQQSSSIDDLDAFEEIRMCFKALFEVRGGRFVAITVGRLPGALLRDRVVVERHLVLTIVALDPCLFAIQTSLADFFGSLISPKFVRCPIC